MIRISSLSVALFATCLYAITILELIEASCPTSATTKASSITITTSCDSNIDVTSSDNDETIYWNDGSSSTLTETIMITSSIYVIEVGIQGGVVTAYRFTGASSGNIGVNLPFDLEVCLFQGVPSISGLAILTITGSLYVITCTGNATLTFDPPRSVTSQSTTITFSAIYPICTHTGICPD